MKRIKTGLNKIEVKTSNDLKIKINNNIKWINTTNHVTEVPISQSMSKYELHEVDLHLSKDEN